MNSDCYKCVLLYLELCAKEVVCPPTEIHELKCLINSCSRYSVTVDWTAEKTLLLNTGIFPKV